MAVIERERPAGTGIVPLTVEQYHRLIESGILPDRAPIELLDGLLVSKVRGEGMTVTPGTRRSSTGSSTWRPSSRAAHRPGTAIGAQELRAFIGGRQAGDRCLYVSTGGFTKEARTKPIARQYL